MIREPDEEEGVPGASGVVGLNGNGNEAAARQHSNGSAGSPGSCNSSWSWSGHSRQPSEASTNVRCVWVRLTILDYIMCNHRV